MLARCLGLQRLLTVGERTLKRGGANITARAGGGQSGSPEKGQCCPQSRGRYGAVPKSRSSCDSQVASPLLSGSTIATSWALLLRHNQQSVGSSWMRPSPGLSHLATHSPSRSSLVSQLATSRFQTGALLSTGIGVWEPKSQVHYRRGIPALQKLVT